MTIFTTGWCIHRTTMYCFKSLPAKRCVLTDASVITQSIIPHSGMKITSRSIKELRGLYTWMERSSWLVQMHLKHRAQNLSGLPRIMATLISMTAINHFQRKISLCIRLTQRVSRLQRVWRIPWTATVFVRTPSSTSLKPSTRACQKSSATNR